MDENDRLYLYTSGVRVRAVIKPDGVAHLVPEKCPSLLCHTTGHLCAYVQRLQQVFTLKHKLRRRTYVQMWPPPVEAESLRSPSLLPPIQPPADTADTPHVT